MDGRGQGWKGRGKGGGREGREGGLCSSNISFKKTLLIASPDVKSDSTPEDKNCHSATVLEVSLKTDRTTAQTTTQLR